MIMSRILRGAAVAALMAAAPLTGAAAERLWSAGPLEWTDFTAEKGTAPLRLNGRIELRPLKSADGSYTIEADAVMDPELSYAAPGVRTPEALALARAQFDMLELGRRNLMRDLASNTYDADALKNRVRLYNDAWLRDADAMARATRSGSDTTALRLASRDVTRRLAENPAPDAPVTLSRSPWRYGASLELGAIFPTASLNTHFSPAATFGVALRGAWRRLEAEALVRYGISSLRTPQLVERPQAGGRLYANTDNANYVAAGFAIGADLLRPGRFSIVPFAGALWTQWSWNARPLAPGISDEIEFEGPQSRVSLNDFNFYAGIHFDWHFNHRLTPYSAGGAVAADYASSLRLTPYVAASAYHASAPAGGWQIGVSLSYSGMFGALHVGK